jgi:hypothetical protein
VLSDLSYGTNAILKAGSKPQMNVDYLKNISYSLLDMVWMAVAFRDQGGV